MIRATVQTVPAVAYYRMSSKKQDTSIPAQRGEVEKFATANGYSIIRWEPYVDEGISGSESEKRDGFQRLIGDATKRRDFDVILCWDQDRFSRFDPMEANYYWYQLRQAGVRIVTVRQGELDFNQLGGWLTASINQHGKAQYLKDLSANVLRGRMARAHQGLWVGSKAPYGYRVNNGRLSLGDPEQIATIKWMFDIYCNTDTSLREIAHDLNERSVPTPGKGLWCASKVRMLLTREAYIGKACQFKESKGKFFTGGKAGLEANTGNSKRDRSQWMTVDCPAIIEQETWDRIRQKMSKRRTRTTPHRGGGFGLLNGLLYCAHCGARLTGSGKPLDSSGDPVYCCSTYNVHGTNGCNRNLIHQSAILGYLVPKVRSMVLDGGNLDRLRDELRRQLGARKVEKPAELNRLRYKVAALDVEIQQAQKELKRTPDDLYEMAVADLRQLREQRKKAATRLQALDGSEKGMVDETEQKVAKALAALEAITERITHADPKVAREALSRIVERVDLWFTHKHGKIVKSQFSRGIVRFVPAPLLISHASPPR